MIIIIYLLLSIIPGHSALWYPMLFPSPFFHVLVFPVFFSAPVSLDFFRVCLFTTKLSAPFRSTLFLTLSEFQAWDWLWYPLNLWSQRQSWGVHGAEIFNPVFCPGRGLNLGPYSWQSGMQPLDQCAPFPKNIDGNYDDFVWQFV